MAHFEGPPQFIPKQEQKDIERNASEVSFEELTKELTKLQSQEKISQAEIPFLLEEINKKLLTEAGQRSEDELLRYLNERKTELFGLIIGKTRLATGDSGNFEHLENALKISTTEGRFGIGEDPGRPYFDTGTRKIYIPPEAMRMLANPDILIALLAVRGSSGAANDVHHELIHSHQTRKPQTSREKLIEALSIFGDKNVLLKEIHAMIGADRKGNGKRIEAEGLRRELSSDSYGLISTEEDVRRLETAALRIKQLYALGLSDEEIGKLVSGAKWDKKSKGYDTLTSEVDRIMRERNLSESEIAIFVKIDELKTRLRIERTRIAAKDVIEDFLR